ncbi:LacI family DNA-binding transcriptional regulator [Leucobacter tenebrionis]|uniref:LacI family DNA-binding transcriptional regulator n=1 Tax=Leucobacter tenebrionis TaxID=2873270 RepID=UPI001CA642F6|nr:LacI family DNA-binding transcriptional regulator [Leucobacter tenebrionis]QZY50916.1 LacI family transcriptional regulator [Leucobacter tenebrionis]
MAREASVSIATVSRVLSGEKTVNPEMAVRVREAAEKVGYRPNSAARGLVSGTFRTIGVTVPDLGNQYFQEVLRAAVLAAKGDGYRIVVMDSMGDADEEHEACLQQVPNVDGLILISPRMTVSQLEGLVETGVPLVMVNRVEPGFDIPTVTSDNHTAIGELCRHLFSYGHRNMVFINNSYPSWQARAREAAMVENAARLGFSLEILRAEPSIEGGYLAADEAVYLSPTAVLAFNDLMAYGVLTRFSELGVGVPERVSVTGFDDIEIARHSVPPLTTVLSPKAQLGRLAWRAMRASLSDKGNAEVAPVAAPVILRRSTGPAPDADEGNAELGVRAR